MDESFRSPAEAKDSFYILSAVVISKAKVFAVREELSRMVGKDYFHATELGRHDSGRMLLRKMASYLAAETKPVVVVVEQLVEKDRNAEKARELATRALWKELAENQLYLTGTVVYERRMRKMQDSSDLRIFKTLRKLKLPGNRLNVIAIATKREPLLWAPDLLAWGFRQAYKQADPSFFSQLGKVAKLIRL